MYKVLVCGGREWRKIDPIKRELKKLPKDTVIIHGACRGADSLAELCAQRLGMKIKAYPAEWDKCGRRAGPIRNQQMLDENPDIEFVLAFHENIEESSGTKDMVGRAEKANIKVEIIKE